MNDFFLNLKSPGWWLGVVVVAFLINLASAYAKPFIDRCMAQISDRRRKKLEIAKNDLEREAEITERKPDGVVLVTLEELKFVLAALLCTSFCILILVFVALPSSLFSASKPPTEFLLFMPVLLLLAFTCMHAANKKATLLKVLKARRDENRA
jgi:flagellar biosynthesis protein FliP